MAKYFVEKAVTIHSKRTYSELETFIWVNGKGAAAEGYNDDLIMALAIGLWVRDTALRLRQEGIDLTRAFLDKIVAKKSTVEPVYKSSNQMAKDTWNMPVRSIPGQMREGEDLKWLL
jgi:hypothetical protein